jgi:hypothetical protein
MLGHCWWGGGRKNAHAGAAGYSGYGRGIGAVRTFTAASSACSKLTMRSTEADAYATIMSPRGKRMDFPFEGTSAIPSQPRLLVTGCTTSALVWLNRENKCLLAPTPRARLPLASIQCRWIRRQPCIALDRRHVPGVVSCAASSTPGS